MDAEARHGETGGPHGLRTDLGTATAEMVRSSLQEVGLVDLKARNGNTTHLDLQFASEVVDRPPFGELSRSDHRPVCIERRGRPRSLVEFRQPPVAPLWRWMPTRAEVAALATRWASWAPDSCGIPAEAQRGRGAIDQVATPRRHGVPGGGDGNVQHQVAEALGRHGQGAWRSGPGKIGPRDLARETTHARCAHSAQRVREGRAGRRAREWWEASVVIWACVRKARRPGPT